MTDQERQQAFQEAVAAAANQFGFMYDADYMIRSQQPVLLVVPVPGWKAPEAPATEQTVKKG